MFKTMCQLVIITRKSDTLKDTAICLSDYHRKQLIWDNRPIGIVNYTWILLFTVMSTKKQTGHTSPSPNQKRIKLLMTSHKQVFTHDKSNIAYILVDSYMYSEWWYLTKQNIKTCIARIKVKFVEHYITHKWGNKCIIMPYQHVFLHHLKIVFVNYMKSFLVS